MKVAIHLCGSIVLAIGRSRRLEELEKLEEVLGSRRGGGRAPDSLWSVLATAASKLAEAAPDLIRALRGGGANFVCPMPAGVGFAPIATAQLPAFHASAAQPGGVVTPIAPAPIPGPGQPATPVALPIVVDPAFIVKTRIVRLFVDNENVAFAGSYLRLEAPSIHEILKGQSVEDLKTFIAGDEILKELVAQDGIDEFIQQMLGHVNELEEQPAAETVTPIPGLKCLHSLRCTRNFNARAMSSGASSSRFPTR